MYKLSAIYYPKIVKIYDDVEQLITENGYEHHKQFLLDVVQEFNATNYAYVLHKSKMAMVITGEFETEEDFNNAKQAIEERSLQMEYPPLTVTDYHAF